MSTQYTLFALTDPNTVHFGFWMTVAIATISGIIGTIIIYNDPVTPMWGMLIAIILATGGVSYGINKLIPLNQPVIGTMAGIMKIKLI